MLNVTRDGDEGFTLNITVNKEFTVCGDGLWSETAKKVLVTDISMYIGAENSSDEGEEASYCDGDLGIIYDEATWNNDTLGLIYTDSEFLEDVRTALINAGISIEAAEAVTYSEQGMQDEGRVSLDAFEVADYVRARMLVTE
jgi:hypothetical protein